MLFVHLEDFLIRFFFFLKKEGETPLGKTTVMWTRPWWHKINKQCEALCNQNTFKCVSYGGFLLPCSVLCGHVKHLNCTVVIKFNAGINNLLNKADVI